MKKAYYKKTYYWYYLVLICGIVIIGEFLFLYSLDPTMDIESLGYGIGLGLFFALFSIIAIYVSSRQYFYVDHSHIRGRNCFFKKIDCDISEVDFVSAGLNSLALILKNGKMYYIGEVKNYREICYCIRQYIPFDEKNTLQYLEANLKSSKKKQRHLLCWLLLSFALMIALVAITVVLTGAREIYEFTLLDKRIFATFVVLEVIIICAIIYITSEIWKSNISVEKYKQLISRHIIVTKPILPGKVISVLCDYNYTMRFLIYENEISGMVYYIVQKLNKQSDLINVYQSEPVNSMNELTINEELTFDLTDHF